MDYQNEDYNLQQKSRMGETIPALGLTYKNYPLIIRDTLVRIILFYIFLFLLQLHAYKYS